MSKSTLKVGPLETRLEASLEHWRRNLLDLTKRNRALNFKPTRNSTVIIVDEQPAEVFRQLYLEGGEMKFRAIPEPKGGRASSISKRDSTPAFKENDGEPISQPGLFDDIESGVSVDFAPYDPGNLEDRHTDDYLQTNVTREQLDRSLRRLDEQARLSIGEQGVNVLYISLGMLHYKEVESAPEILRAPLLLVPVQLQRKSARAGYSVSATDDDPMVNPGLAEYLRRNFAVHLPELPDLAGLTGTYNLQEYFQRAKESITELQSWAIKTDIVLGLFSFQKLAMYKDLEGNAHLYRQHPLIQRLVSRETSATHMSLPPEIDSLQLDEDFAPERTFQVVDADSSQLKALAAVARNYDLVIEGPPGTGKSQTITNLIAQALSMRKSVLFVAEKMAALKVVHQRLVAAGLGEFCLELHSTKANKREVMKELRLTLDASLQTPELPKKPSALRLPNVRRNLTNYARAVHAPYGALKISPYDAFGELGLVLKAPKLRYSGPTDTVTAEQLDQCLREIDELATLGVEIGVPSQHPWRDAATEYYTEDDLDTIGGLCTRLLQSLESLVSQARRVESELNLPPVGRLADIETAAAIAAVIGRSPGAPLAVLSNEIWNAPPAAAQSLVTLLNTIHSLKARVLEYHQGAVLEMDIASDIAYVEQKSRGALRFLSIFDSRYRDISRKWRTVRTPNYHPSMAKQALDLKTVVELQGLQKELRSRADEASQLFGVLWQGEHTEPTALEGYIRWVVEFRTLCIRHGLGERALATATQSDPDITLVTQLQHLANTVSLLLKELQEAVGWPAGYLMEASLHEMGTRVFRLSRGLHLGPRWAAFEAARASVARGLGHEFLQACLAGELGFEALRAAFLRAFYQKWLAGVVQERPELQTFSTLTHEQRIEEFRRLDRKVLEENQSALVASLRRETQLRLQMPDIAEAMPVLRRELTRQRGLSPLRQTLKRASAVIRTVKPCFMMSPLSVAQLLDGNTTFDLVIFDEASQLTTEDAIGAIVRGRQLVVVGDPKQLPPTNFFAVMTGQEIVPVGEDNMPLYEDSESVLEEYLASGVPPSRLKWHYRSSHESLIAFSNVNFYDSELLTFPSADPQSPSAGLKFEWVADGVYEGKGLNRAEARRVADAVVEHARNHPELSLGVGTFNQRQQLAIQDELEQRRRDDPGLEPFFARKEQEEFFVKNLENIQGDERDVIFISVTYAKGHDGRLRHNFGPLNSQNGWRRLNVLVTRARKLMRVFSSIHGDDINPHATVSLGPKLLKDFLNYAEHGRLDSIVVKTNAATESPFEQDVYRALTEKGLSLIPQVGVSGYRIDFGVLDPDQPSRFICGLECDGVAYHSSQTARDRDRLRQQVLEARGWSIHRIWSTDWFKDRSGQIKRVLAAVKASQERARNEAKAAPRKPASISRNANTSTEVVWPSGSDEVAAYERPVAPAYRQTSTGSHRPGNILTVPEGELMQAILKVAEVEAPVHQDDVLTRVAAMWGVKLGSRIRNRITTTLNYMRLLRRITMRGEFVYHADSKGRVRSRADTKIPPERVAPEEYREAILLVLSTGASFTASEIASEVRAVLGYGKTTEHIQAVVAAQVQELLKEQLLGEGSLGLTLRH